VQGRDDNEWVAWLASAGRDRDEVVMCSAPIEVGPMLQRDLFDKKSSVIMTSATLRTGGSFDYVKSRLGFEDVREEAVDSSFPYQEAALLLLPRDVPDPQHPRYTPALHQALIDLCTASEGRALVLFTSYGALQTAFRAIRPVLEPQGYRVLAQGTSGTPHQMLAELRTRPHTMLLGTSSFWEGVDVVGEALSLLVITRLPFTVPSEPVFAARSERFEDPFREYAVPQAVLRFRQGFGRLIRSRSDRGVCVVLDARALSKNYGATFVKSLPPAAVRPCLLSEAPGLVREWLDPAEER
jgi:DNA polymerase-3 subunit epsilon/ATP-dependent DNA helicase DinG